MNAPSQDTMPCPLCKGEGAVPRATSGPTYPEVGSLWQDNDPRMRQRKVRVVGYHGERVAVRSEYGGNRLSYINVRKFGLRGRAGFSHVPQQPTTER